MHDPAMNEPGDAPNDTHEAPFADRIHRILLNDFHPGEYTGWGDLPQNTIDSAIDHTDHFANGALIEFYDFDPDLDENPPEAIEAGMADTDYWILTGTFDQLLACFNDLTPRLATVIYDWYGLGGDDNCYDYWPNSMILASKFLDSLAKILTDALRANDADDPAEIHDPDDELAYDRAERNLEHAKDDLNRIYWLARLRYANSCDPIPPTSYREMRADADKYFELDILASEPFGSPPSWLLVTRPNA